MARAWCAAPDEPRNAQGLLECAKKLVKQNRAAPTQQMSEMPLREGMISFVVCSIDPLRLGRLTADLERCFASDTYELIHIDDARSLSEGYMRGLHRARGESIVFCHDDIGLISPDFATALRRQLMAFDLIGLAGTARLSGPTWFWSGPLHSAARIATPSGSGIVAGLLGAQVGAMADAQALDGVFIAGRREVFEHVPFDRETFDGFHFYDIDQSYRAFLAGYRCGVALDLLIWHQSGGDFTDSWHLYADRFMAKFPEFSQPRPGTAYRPGALLLDEISLAPAIYRWVDHWLIGT